jgi:glycosyltransferase involved in cell wall biosynthesis
MQASLYSSFYHKPLIIWWEGTLHTEGWVSGSRKSIRRLLLQRAARYWSNGRESEELLATYGVPRSRIDNGMIGADTLHLWKASQVSMKRRDQLRTELGISGVVFLFVGQFVRRKGILEYLKALEILASITSVEFSSLFVGDGPEKPVLRDWCARHPQVKVKILEFQQPAQIPRIYAACDVFVLPTLDDNWSLVALEAAATGMPQILSIYNGASSDLLAAGAPGSCIDPLDTESFAGSLKRVAEEKWQRLNGDDVQGLAQCFSSESVMRRACNSISMAME